MPYYNDTDRRQSMFNDNVNLLNVSTTANIALEQYVMLPRVFNQEIIGTRRDAPHRRKEHRREPDKSAASRFREAIPLTILVRIAQRNSDRLNMRSAMCVFGDVGDRIPIEVDQRSAKVESTLRPSVV